MNHRLTVCVWALSLVINAPDARAQFAQQGPKLSSNSQATFGAALALSADGNTLVVGGPSDDSSFDGGSTGAGWVYTRTGGVWTLQQKLVGTGAIGRASQGTSVAISGDGNTVLIGGIYDDLATGATWVFTRSGGEWSQQQKLVGSFGVGYQHQGRSVALSYDGNTALVGGGADNSLIGAAWVFVRANGTWAQDGPKLIGLGQDGAHSAAFNVALSGDGLTAVIARPADGSGNGLQHGAVWVFTRTVEGWEQQGSKLIGSGASEQSGTGAAQGSSVSLSHDGNTLAVGGLADDYLFSTMIGATWIFTRDQFGVWSQQGNKLIGTGAEGGGAAQGAAVSLTPDGNKLLVGGPLDQNNRGALWMFTRSGATWTQVGQKLVAYQSESGPIGAKVGVSAALAADGKSLAAGGPYSNNFNGAVWTFTSASSIAVQSGDAQTAYVGTAFAPLSVRVVDSAANPIPNILIELRAQTGQNGAEGSFASFDPVYTNASGIATASTLTANHSAGTFTVTATAPGLPAPATFHLTSSSQPVPPATVVATATAPTQVAVMWTASGGATTYEVVRSSNGAEYTTVGTTTSTSLTDAAAVAGTAYLYKVRVVSPAASPYSAADLATTIVFTDSALAGTRIRASLIDELRTAVNAVRFLAGSGAYAYTDSPLAAGTPTKAVHVTDLRAALSAARTSLALPTLLYTQPALAAGAPMLAVDLTELRAGVQ